MKYGIRMGIPEKKELWDRLQKEYKDGSINRIDKELYLKWGKSLKLLSENPRHTGLHTHEIEPLSKRYGIKVWESYIENRKSKAKRLFWVYGPDKLDITIIGL